MAMTGLRRVTVGLGLLEEPPPSEIAREGVPALLACIPPEHRDEAIELAHWGYGALGGVAYGLLSRSLRRGMWAGPAYGLGIWALFELVLAPAFGIRTSSERSVAERAALAADHVLYGAIVAGKPRAK